MSTAPVEQPFVPDAIVDTNVILPIYSWHDLLDVGDRVLAANPAATLEDPALAFRRGRARTAFLLTLLFNERKWKVMVPLHEVGRTLLRGAPPDSVTANFTKLYLHFVTDLLPDWSMAGDLEDDENIVGDDVDLLCVRYAEHFRVPFISWEGDTPAGPDPTKLIPTESKARGIDLVTPEQMLQRHAFDERPAIKRFFSAWDARAAEYLKGNPSAKETMRVANDFFERLAENYWGR